MFDELKLQKCVFTIPKLQFTWKFSSVFVYWKIVRRNSDLNGSSSIPKSDYLTDFACIFARIYELFQLSYGVDDKLQMI